MNYLKIPVLPYKGEVFEEVRYAHFLEKTGYTTTPLPMKILSFGACNYSCPYCKRNGYRKEGNYIKDSIWVETGEIAEKVKEHLMHGYVIRLSGGDPCCFGGVAKAIAKYVKRKGGMVSIAHNGSDPEFVQQLIDYTDFWAIDLKSIRPDRFRRITGTGNKSNKYLNNTLMSISLVSWYDIPVEVRTIIFDDTEESELIEIAKFLKSCANPNLYWTLRLYKGQAVGKFKSPELTKVTDMARRIREAYPVLKIGIRKNWNGESGLLTI
ncbi:radical SAM protein [Caldicellulosiruptor hydrothermalis]|uniref:radical SAM protein n=1 Tax=Caldicellulosiruptor hydrothermalis TaxID=413888 RepID=UPI0011D0C7BB|nr:radical SAM protein [Caldicellulosiruptor hydrothermalis]